MTTQIASRPVHSPGLELLERAETHERMAQYMRGQQLNILEAGCGRRWQFEKGSNTITGVDQDQHAMEHRRNTHKDLDIAVLGDLRTVVLPDASFDVIYCSFVLEHIDGAEAVLNRFIRWLKPGGTMILTFPDRDGVYGFFTRITPFWMHVIYKRNFEGIKNAGKPGFVPYKTFYDAVISRRRFREYAAAHDLDIVEECGFGHVPRPILPLLKIVWLLTLGRLATHKNLMYVLRKSV